MRSVSARSHANMLTAEAVAAALVLGAELRVTTHSAMLQEACDAVGVPHRVVTL
jgi:hypothetical protein